jgi:hypothetical protein
VVTPVKGMFAESLRGPDRPTGPLAFAHLDSDLYESVAVSLEAVFDLVAPGGIIVIDDFFHPAQGPARAWSDFRNRRRLRSVLHVTFPYSVLIFKGETAAPGMRRAFDGNYYSLDLMRSNDELLTALVEFEVREPSSSRRRLRELLEKEVEEYGDIYDYWACLEYFWRRIDYRPDGNEEWVI